MRHILLSSFIPLFLFTGNALADDLSGTNLQMSGNIIAQSCDIGTTSADVHIGDFPQYSFASTGDVSPAKGFDIKLLNCSPNISGSSITFSGTEADSSNTDLLALTDTGGTGDMASGVAIQILDNAGAPLALNKASEKLPLVAGDNTLHFQLRYKATAVPVKPGNANSVMYFDMTYQ
ncbi:fimbrial protein [Enterobacter quasiroggenkampii]|uniref:fimbrial protein n=1 Tax=Enterobacter quasiroggenkampii TaxID=2497436 RepID=UPI0021CFBADB|nr:fimbrial protein [Enterobacter quasiroggenkampii]MCU6306351.1 fimbrial protein [Enterobacter quasiroggenkampii]MCU6398431.1 fimbrial protein [Enterobacter quasiroggenkampii]